MSEVNNKGSFDLPKVKNTTFAKNEAPKTAENHSQEAYQEKGLDTLKNQSAVSGQSLVKPVDNLDTDLSKLAVIMKKDPNFGTKMDLLFEGLQKEFEKQGVEDPYSHAAMAMEVLTKELNLT